MQSRAAHSLNFVHSEISNNDPTFMIIPIHLSSTRYQNKWVVWIEMKCSMSTIMAALMYYENIITVTPNHRRLDCWLWRISKNQSSASLAFGGKSNNVDGNYQYIEIHWIDNVYRYWFSWSQVCIYSRLRSHILMCDIKFSHQLFIHINTPFILTPLAMPSHCDIRIIMVESYGTFSILAAHVRDKHIVKLANSPSINEIIYFLSCHWNGNVFILTTFLSPFWWNFHHWLHWKLSFWQLPVQPVMKILSKWQHFCFSVPGTDCTGSCPAHFWHIINAFWFNEIFALMKCCSKCV